MITCPNCNKEVEDGLKFCVYCGKELPKAEATEQQVEVTEQQVEATEQQVEVAEQQVEVAEQQTETTPAKPKKKLSKKLIAILAAVVAVILVVVILFTTVFNTKSKDNFALYLKENQMYMTKASNIKPWQVTDEFLDEDSYLPSYAATTVAEFTHITKDGKMVFYIDHTEDSYDGGSLYCRYVNNSKKEPTKIDDEVRCYTVSDSGKIVTYLTADEDALYQHNLKDKEKIDEYVEWFKASDDGKKIIYLNDEYELYFKQSNKDKEKIDSDIDEVQYVSEDLSFVYYTKEDNLYKKEIGKEKVKIASDIEDVIGIYESGEVYYTKSNSQEIKLSDFVEDDMKEADQAMTRPVSPKYPYRFDFDSTDEYNAAKDKYDKEYDAYWDDLSEWYAKEERDDIREDLKYWKMDINANILFYYNGKTEKEVTKEFGEYETAAKDSPAVVYSTYDLSGAKKVKISEIFSAWDAESTVEDALMSSSNKYVAVKGSTSAIEQKEANSFYITSDGKTVYFADKDSKSGDTNIYKVDISGSKAKKPEVYAKDISVIMGLLENDELVYLVDMKDSDADLYNGKKKIDRINTMVNYNFFKYIASTDTFLYLDDSETLKMSHNGKITKIADDVYDYTYTPNGEILYLGDYSTNHDRGTLYIYKNNKSVKVDDDVSAIIPLCERQEYLFSNTYSARYLEGYIN